MKGRRINEKVCAIDDTTQVHTLARQPTVLCNRCGAKAHDPANVCDPVQLPDAGWFGD
jgi:hypothetical protein